jgi:hypothetical protein
MGVQDRFWLVALLGFVVSCVPFPQTQALKKIDLHLGSGVEDSCIPLTDCFIQAKSAYAQGDPAAAADLLKTLLSERPKPPWKGRILLLLG